MKEITVLQWCKLLTWPGLVQDHLRKTSIVNRQLQFPPVSSRVRANCLMENTTTSSSIRRELQWRKVDLDKKLYGYVFVSNTFPQHMTRICCWSRKKSETNPSRPRPRPRPKVGRPRPRPRPQVSRPRPRPRPEQLLFSQTLKPSATRTCFSCMLMMPTSSFLKNPRVQFTCL